MQGSLQVPNGEARIAWVSQGLCRSTDPDQLFVRGAAQRKAAVICRHCPVIAECGADALDNRVEFGVWGGMTERQRRALLKQHPEVSITRKLPQNRAERKPLRFRLGNWAACGSIGTVLKALRRRRSLSADTECVFVDESKTECRS